MAEIPNVIGGETITSEWGNDIRDRAVMRYATVAARTAGHPSPTAGDLAYMEDSGDVDIYHAGGWRHLGTQVGVVQMLAGGSVPIGWLVCNGSAVSRTTYANLFTTIGTAWGAGDGTTTFNLPDFRGRYPRGVATSGAGDALGEAFGSDLIVDHTHPVDAPSTTSAATATPLIGLLANPAPNNAPGAGHTHAVDIASFDTGSVNGTNPTQLPASKAINFIIKT